MKLGQRRPPRKATPRKSGASSAVQPVNSSNASASLEQAKETEGIKLTVERLAHDGRGVAHAPSGKTVFIEQALPGEQVEVRIHRQRGRYDEGHVTARHSDSSARVTPQCPHFGRCGGCALQHLAPAAQLAHKQQVVIEHFQREGLTLDVQHTVTSAPYGYRRRARLGVNVDRQGRRLLGYRHHRSERLCAITTCPVLTPALQRLLTPLQALLEQLAAPRQVGHVELLDADEGCCVVVRQLRAHPEDEQRWQRFAAPLSVRIIFARGQQESQPATMLPALSYTLTTPNRTLQLAFRPGDFVQINRDVNQRLLDTVLHWLAPLSGKRVLDLFAGVGNFTLGLAASGAVVHALEGQQEMVSRLLSNAAQNELSQVSAAVADLTQVSIEGDDDVVVLDPPRDGARAVCAQLAKHSSKTVVYISCDPATLARDAALLAQGGYRPVRAAIVDMFPQTAHLETLVQFTRL